MVHPFHIRTDRQVNPSGLEAIAISAGACLPVGGSAHPPSTTTGASADQITARIPIVFLPPRLLPKRRTQLTNNVDGYEFSKRTSDHLRDGITRALQLLDA